MMTLDYWQGRKVRLRAMVPSDISLFTSFDDEVSRNVDAIYWPQSPERQQTWFDEERQKKRTDDSFRWIAENADGTPVGTIDTFSCNQWVGSFKYGIAVAPSYQGQGFGSEMVFLVLRYYFHELRYQKVTPHVFSFNEASIRMHEKLGFVREGQLRNLAYTGGKYYDEIYFGMTRDEFDERYPDAAISP